MVQQKKKFQLVYLSGKLGTTTFISIQFVKLAHQLTSIRIHLHSWSVAVNLLVNAFAMCPHSQHLTLSLLQLDNLQSLNYAQAKMKWKTLKQSNKKKSQTFTTHILRTNRLQSQKQTTLRVAVGVGVWFRVSDEEWSTIETFSWFHRTHQTHWIQLDFVW